MTIVKNESGSKQVNISKNADGYGGFVFRAVFVQVYDGEQDVISSKTYKSENRAKSWAKKQLSNS